ETARRNAGNAAERVVKFLDTEPHAAREFGAVEQHFRHQIGPHLRAVGGLVGIPRTARAEHGAQFERVPLADRLGLSLRWEDRMTDIEDARDFVRALKKLADLHEIPSFVVN